jgi:hypothetical protein
VPFPVVVLSKSSEGWGCGIPPFAKCAKDGPPSFVVVSAYSGFLTGLSALFGMTRFYGGLRHYEVVAFPVVVLSKSSEGWGCGIPPFAKCAKDGPPSFVVVSAYSRFLSGLSALFGMTKFYAGLRHY